VSTNSTGQADLVFLGNAWTAVGDPATVTHAVAVAGGRIAAVGDAAAAMAATAGEVIEVGDGLLLPGFGDGHAHPVFAGIEALFAPVRHQTDVAAVVDAVGRWAADHPGESWVRGGGYDPTLAPDGRFDARWLDAVVPDRPVFLQAADYHTAWVNTAALDLAGIDASTPDPHDGQIVRGPDGGPLGTLREWGAWQPVHALLPPLTDQQRATALRTASAAYAANGVTWVQDAWVDPDTLDTWLAGAARDALAVRANLAWLAKPDGWREDLPAFLEQRGRAESDRSGLLTGHTVKFFADGVIESGTGHMLQPYVDQAHSHGLPNWDAAELAEAVTAVDAQGFQPHIHAIGDAAVRAALDAIEAAERRNGGRDRRAVVAHVQLVEAADIDRFTRLGATACVQPLWAQLDPLQLELTVPRLGAERAERQYPLASMLRAGVALSMGSDWPVTSLVPLQGIAVAVTRQTAAGEPVGGWVPTERLTVDQALRAYTAGSAHQAFADGDSADRSWGLIRPGAQADLTLLAADPRLVPPADIAGITVLGTWLAGRQTYPT
jgi:predicted amidohydrolase YtcJ